MPSLKPLVGVTREKSHSWRGFLDTHCYQFASIVLVDNRIQFNQINTQYLVGYTKHPKQFAYGYAAGLGNQKDIVPVCASPKTPLFLVNL